MNENPEKQNPYFAYATEHPSGKPLDIDKPDSTLSRDIEIGANGPPKTPLQITVTHNGIPEVVSPANAEYNDSGRFFMVVVGLKDGVNDFGLREFSSSLPSDTWELTVGAAEKLEIISIKDQKGVEVPHGTTTSATSFVVSGQARRNSTIYLLIDEKRQPGLIGVDGNDNWTANTGTQAPGLHSFAIEGNYDSGPVSTPPRTVNIEDLEDFEDFEGIPDIKLTSVGQSASTKNFRITLLSKSGAGDYVHVADLWDIGPVKGKSLYGYIQLIPGSISYRLDLLGRTANRITLWAVGGNITTPSANLTLTFRNPAGSTLHTINRTLTFAGNLQQIDSGILPNIASIEITANGQVIFDEFRFL